MDPVRGRHRPPPFGVRRGLRPLRRPAARHDRRPRSPPARRSVPVREPARAWIEVDDGRIVDAGYAGSGWIGATTVRLGRRDLATLEAFSLPDLQDAPEVSATAARFVQTAGGRTGLPAPRRVSHPPFVQFNAADRVDEPRAHDPRRRVVTFEVAGASTFPRHWIYDDRGQLAAKVGLTDFKEWYRHSFGKHSPWGDENSPAYVTAVETALERQLSSTSCAAGAKPKIRNVKAGKHPDRAGRGGRRALPAAQRRGGGAGRRRAPRRARAGRGPRRARRSPSRAARGPPRSGRDRLKVAVASADQIDRAHFVELSTGHRRVKQRASRSARRGRVHCGRADRDLERQLAEGSSAASRSA